jgi:hypothetical protein
LHGPFDILQLVHALLIPSSTPQPTHPDDALPSGSTELNAVQDACGALIAIRCGIGGGKFWSAVLMGRSERVNLYFRV